MTVPLRERVRCLRRVIRRNANAGRRTTVMVVGGRISALSERDPLIQELMNRGAVVVGTFPLETTRIDMQPLPSEESLYEAVNDMIDAVDTLKQASAAIQRSTSGQRIGSSNCRATLNEDVVKVMRRSHENLKIGYKALEIITGIPWGTVKDVCSYRTWTHVR